MSQPKPHANPRTAMRTVLATIALVLASTALAQWNTGWDAYMAQYNANMDAWVAQRQVQIQAEQQQWMMHFVRLYREETGDDQTPDALAFERGLNLYCAQGSDAPALRRAPRFDRRCAVRRSSRSSFTLDAAGRPTFDGVTIDAMPKLQGMREALLEWGTLPGAGDAYPFPFRLVHQGFAR